jgi:hypothetical protein
MVNKDDIIKILVVKLFDKYCCLPVEDYQIDNLARECNRLSKRFISKLNEKSND